MNRTELVTLDTWAQHPNVTLNVGAAFTSISALLDRQAIEYAHRPALLCPGRDPLVYADLRRYRDQVQILLHECGVGRTDRVVVLAPEGADLALTFVAVASVATAVPLNPTLAVPELRAAFDEVQPTVALVHTGIPRATRRWALGCGTPVIELAPDPAAAAGICGLHPQHLVAGHGTGRPTNGDLGLILPTSGTTARPRYVPLSQRNLLMAAGATCAAYQLTSADRRLNVMPLVHVQGLVGCVLAALVSGSSVVCLPGFDPRRFQQAIDEYVATWYSATPTMHASLLAMGAPRGAASTLRFVRSGSGPLNPELRDRLEDMLEVPVVESYGMTEAHQVASTSIDPSGHRRGTVGRPTGSWVAIADDQFRPLPRGHTGAILIRGANVFGGYLKPERSAFTGEWFNTGDIGYLDDDGYLSILGRSKELINRGGEKIVPAEIDRALLSHGEVIEAAAFGLPHDLLQEEIVAAVVLADSGDVTERMLMDHLRDRLAPHKIPRRIFFVTELPRNAMRKVMRNKLSENLGDGKLNSDHGAKADGQMTALQTAVLGLWKEALHLEAIGLDDDFFAVGGDSLTGAHLLNMVEEVFRVELSPMWMYDKANTVASMATLIDEMRRGRHPNRTAIG